MSQPRLEHGGFKSAPAPSKAEIISETTDLVHPFVQDGHDTDVAVR
jgi:hypothetical protein